MKESARESVVHPNKSGLPVVAESAQFGRRVDCTAQQRAVLERHFLGRRSSGGTRRRTSENRSQGNDSAAAGTASRASHERSSMDSVVPSILTPVTIES